MHNKLTRSYITFCLFCLVSCLLPPGGFTVFEEYRGFMNSTQKRERDENDIGHHRRCLFCLSMFQLNASRARENV